MNKNIHLQIAKDMKISRFPNETENDFIGRVIYSALSEWIKASTFDRKIDDQEGVTDVGCTKHHITRKCGDILEGFLEVYPQIKSYFFSIEEKEQKPIQEIQKRLLLGGVLVSGENNTVQLSQEKSGFISDTLFFERGNFFKMGKQVSGLGCYTNTISQNIPISQFEDLFFIPPENAEETFHSFYQLMESKFETFSTVPEYWNFFDFSSKRSFYNSWVGHFNEEGKITVYKNSNNPLDSGLAKHSNEELSIAKFPSHIAETKEIRRIMYGLRAIENNPCQAKLTLKGDSVSLEFYTSLPQREQTLLYMIAWPVRNMYDRTQYIAQIEFLPTIKKMLNNLNVNFKVING
jgi:hypothetical protein